MVTVETLDGQRITVQERHHASNRFAQEELENVMKQLAETQKKYKHLEEGHNKSLNEIEERENAVKTKEQKLKDSQKKIKEMQRELETKNGLLKRKTAELTKACEKHYELEQELAFYKIDHKFETLSRPKPLSTDEESLVDEDGLLGESPYLGKGRFKKNERVKQGRSPAAKPSPVHYATMSQPTKGIEGGGDGSYLEENIQHKQAQLEQLDARLANTQGDLAQAESKLGQFNTELVQTQQQIALATQELVRQNEAAQMMRHLTEDDKQGIRRKLTKKIDKVHDLRDTTQRIESDLQETEGGMRRQEQEIGQLRGRMRHLSSTDSLFHEIADEVEDKEEKLDAVNHQYYDLQNELRDMLHRITQETSDMKKLEGELRDGQVQENGAMRDELQEIIDGLQHYLRDVEGRADRQKDEYEQLMSERHELLGHMKDLEKDRQVVHDQQHELSNLREKMLELEGSLAQERDLNDSLNRHMNETRGREDREQDITVQLQDAEDEIDRLRNALQDADKNLQKQDDKYQQVLEEENKKQGMLKRRAKAADHKDEEIALLQKQLSELQKANTRFQDQLWGMEQSLTEQKQQSIEPQVLRHRLDDVMHAVRTGQGAVEPEHSEDEIGTVMRDLRDDMEREMGRTQAQADRAIKDKQSAEAEVRRLKDAITQAQEDEREFADRAIQTLLDDQKKETDRLRAQLARLQDELERERSDNQDRAIPVQYLQPSTKASTSTTTASTSTGTTVYSATSSEQTTSEEESSTIPSSAWSKKRREMYDSFTPDEQALFDELQQEIDFLKQLLARRDKKAAEKAIQVIDEKAQQLRDMLDKRHSNATTSGSLAPASTRRSRSATRGHDSKQGHSRSHRGHKETSSERGERETNGSRHRFKAGHKHDDPRLEAAVQELVRAQREIDALQDELHDKNDLLSRELKRNGKTSNSTAVQKEEIDDLYDILEDQKAEILKLNGMLDRIEHPQRDGGAYEAEVRDFLRAADDLRSSMLEQRPRVEKVSARHAHAYADPSHYNHADHPRSDHHARGRPVPTFYDENQRDQDQYYGDRPGVHPQYPGENPARPLSGYPQVPVPSGYDDVTHPKTSMSQMPQPHGLPQPFPQQHILQPHNMMPQPHNMMPQPHNMMPQPQGVAHPPPIQVPGTYPQGVPQSLGQNGYGPQGQGQIHGGSVPQSGHAQGYQGRGDIRQGQAEGQEVIHGMMGPDGQIYLPEGHEDVNLDDAVILQRSPPGHQRSRSLGDLQFSAASTPIAGPGAMLHGGHVTPDTSYMQPTMMSTPLPDSARKGILKKSRSEEGLVCNVPQHHDMEDYVEKLQDKIRRLKSKTKRDSSRGETAEARRVLFEDEEATTVHRLQAELQDRKAELEGLDLAIEGQKKSLRGMKDSEKHLLAKREAAREELYRVKHGKASKRQRRRDYLDEELNINPYESDYDYEYPPRSAVSRKDYLIEEIDCLEETLAKRRAELREADKLLMETELDLAEAQKEARSTIQQYDQAKHGFQTTVRDTAEIEKRAREAGIQLITTEDNIQAVEQEFAELRQARVQQQQVLLEIQNLISGKDEEYSGLNARIVDAESRLTELRTDLVVTESKQDEKLSALQDADRVIAERRRHIEAVTKQEEKELQTLRSENNRRSTEIEKVEQHITKERRNLDTLVRQRDTLQTNIDQLHTEKEIVANETRDMHAKLQQMKRAHSELQDNVTSRSSRLGAIEDELGRIESLLTSSLTDAEALRSASPPRATDLFESGIEERIRYLGKEITSRDKDKHELADALSRSYNEVQALRRQLTLERREVENHLQSVDGSVTPLKQQLDDKSQELKYVKEKANKELANLEAIAHAHASRAQRLSDEMAYLRAEYMEVKRQLDNQKQLQERDEELGETLRELKTDLTFEIKGGVRELGESQRDVTAGDVSALHSQKQHLQQHLHSLRDNLSTIRSMDEDVPHSTSHSFAQQQQLLKQQLQLRMSRQADALSAHRHISQSHIQSLQERLEELEQVLSQADVKGLSQVDHIISAAKAKLNSFTPVKDSNPQPLVRSPTTEQTVYRVQSPYSDNIRMQSPLVDKIRSESPGVTNIRARSPYMDRRSPSPRISGRRSPSPRTNHLTQFARISSPYSHQMNNTEPYTANKLSEDILAQNTISVENRETSGSGELTSEDIKNGWPVDKKKKRRRSRSPSLRVREIWESLIADDNPQEELKVESLVSDVPSSVSAQPFTNPIPPKNSLPTVPIPTSSLPPIQQTSHLYSTPVTSTGTPSTSRDNQPTTSVTAVHTTTITDGPRAPPSDAISSKAAARLATSKDSGIMESQKSAVSRESSSSSVSHIPRPRKAYSPHRHSDRSRSGSRGRATQQPAN